jgi:acyl transferase domain-containing protein
VAEGVLGVGVLPWVVSGKGVGALRAQARRLVEYVEGAGGVDLVDVAHALVVSRSCFSDRAVVLGGERGGLLGGLDALARGEVAGGVFEGRGGGRGAGVAYLFSGQGAQRAGMGAGLCEVFPVFRGVLGEVCELMDGLLGCSLRGVLFACEGSSEAGLLDRTEFTQVGLFALEVALFRLLESFGLAPDYLMGHSVGELAAAHVAGVLSLEDACVLVAARGRLMGALPGGGAMVAVQASEEEARQELVGYEHAVALAGVNGPGSVVFSGDEQPVLELAGVFERRGRKTRRLRVSHAFHSPRMDGMLEEFAQVAAGLSFSRPGIPVVSNVSGRFLDAEQACDPGYWVRHVRETVRFADGVRLLADRGVGSFLELGPDGVLSALAQECLLETDSGDTEPHATLSVPVLRAERPEAQSLLGALARLHVHGIDVDFASLFTDRPTPQAQLPTYAFQRERYWLGARAGVGDLAAAGQEPAGHPLLGAALALADGEGWLFTGRLSLQSHPWLADHAVAGVVLLPGTAFVDVALHVGGLVGCELLQELILQAPLVLGERDEVQLQLKVGEPDEAGCRGLDVYSRVVSGSVDEVRPAQSWTHNASGLLAPGEPMAVDGLSLAGSGALMGSNGAPVGLDGALDRAGGALAGESWPPAGAVEVALEDLYERLEAQGFGYGPTFQCLRAVWQGEEELFAEVSLSEQQQPQADLFGLHPALLDASLHALLASPFGAVDEAQGPLLPFSWSEVHLGAVGASLLRVRLSPAIDGGVSLWAVDGAGAGVLSARSLAMRPVSADQLSETRTPHQQVHRVGWTPVSLQMPTVEHRLVLLGAQDTGAAHALRAARVDFETHKDLSSLSRAIEEGAPTPRFVIVDGAGGWAQRVADRDRVDGSAGDGGVVEAAGGPILDGGYTGADDASGSVADAVRESTHGALEIVQAWITEERPAGCRLAVLTAGAVAALVGEDLPGLAQAGVWGLVRTAQSEHPECFALVDLDTARVSWEVLPEALLLAGSAGEDQLAIRDGEVFAPRMMPIAQETSSREDIAVGSDVADGVVRGMARCC